MPWISQKDWQELNDKLDAIHRLAVLTLKVETRKMDQLEADVAAQGSVVQSVVTLLQGLKAQLDAAGTDKAKLAALSQQIEANTSALSSAVTANTPAA